MSGCCYDCSFSITYRRGEKEDVLVSLENGYFPFFDKYYRIFSIFLLLSTE